MIDSGDLSFDDESFNLATGQMIIWSHALDSLSDHLTYLIERAKYYDGTPLTKQEYVETLEHILSRTEQIKKTNQGAK